MLSSYHISSQKNLHSYLIQLSNYILGLPPLQITSFYLNLSASRSENITLGYMNFWKLCTKMWIFFFFFWWERGFHTFIYNPQRVPRPLTKRLKSTVVMFFVLSAQPSLFFRRSACAPGPVNLLYGAGLFKALNIYVSISMLLIWLIYFVPCENYKISTFTVI